MSYPGNDDHNGDHGENGEPQGFRDAGEVRNVQKALNRIHGRSFKRLADDEFARKLHGIIRLRPIWFLFQQQPRFAVLYKGVSVGEYVPDRIVRDQIVVDTQVISRRQPRMTTTHKWTFAPRFRRHAFGWRSQTPIQRIKEAVSEIKKVARKEPVAAAEGAVLFLEKVSAAIEHVDSSSGAIGTAVNNAIAALVPIIAEAPSDDGLREKWLHRLWQSVEEDEMPYLELLPEYGGDLCVEPEIASRWADAFIDTLRFVWNPDGPGGGWFKGTFACLSALHKAERYAELVELVELDPHRWWNSRIWGVKALAAQGKMGEAIRFAEATRDEYASPVSMAQTCEDILLSDGWVDDAYSRYALEAHRKATNLATFRAVAAKYPDKSPADILRDLVAHTPGEEGKWFAAAKSVGLYAEAINLAKRTPCDPKTLTRAARDMVSENPRFAAEAGLAALRWLIAGYGYDIIGTDVSAAYRHTVKAAANAGCLPQITARIRALLEHANADGFFATGILRELLEHDPGREGAR